MGEGTQVGMVVPNLFLRVPVETAVRSTGLSVRWFTEAEQAERSGCEIVIADLEALGADPAAAVRRLVGAGKTVLAFGPHVRGEMLAAARAAGAVVLPRSVFLRRLPELLAAAAGRSAT